MNPKDEPVGWGGILTGIAVALIPFLREFNIYNMTEGQTSSFLGLLAAIIIAGTFYVRSRVTPVDKANEVITDAFNATPGIDTKPTL